MEKHKMYSCTTAEIKKADKREPSLPTLAISTKSMYRYEWMKS
jgi:hypothetical protein